MKDMPSKFRPDNLVVLRMPNSKILEELWKGDKVSSENPCTSLCVRFEVYSSVFFFFFLWLSP